MTRVAHDAARTTRRPARSMLDVLLLVLAALAVVGAFVEYRAHGLTIIQVVFAGVVALTVLREWRRSRASR